jgi:four helix bundle protein
MIRDVMDLEVYKESLRMLEVLYELLRKVPRSEYDSVLQSKRAAKSICANIAEGFAKRSSGAEFKRFLKIAIGSSDEVVTHLRTLKITVNYLSKSINSVEEEYILLSKRLNKLCSVWKSGNF